MGPGAQAAAVGRKGFPGAVRNTRKKETGLLRRLAVGGWRRWAVGGPRGPSLRAVLNKKTTLGFFQGGGGVSSLLYATPRPPPPPPQ